NLASTAGNWMDNNAPVAGDSITFQPGGPYFCVLDPASTNNLSDLTAVAGALGTIVVARDVTVTNNLSIMSAMMHLTIAQGSTLTGRAVTLSPNMEMSGAGTLRVAGNAGGAGQLTLNQVTVANTQINIDQTAG